MAYTDNTFYTENYYGEVLSEDNCLRWLERASDMLDVLTFGRLVEGFPTNAVHADKVRKAVCAMAEALFHIDEHRAAAAVKKSADGEYHGPVTSMTSGKESISFAVNSSASMYSAAVTDERVRHRLLFSVAAGYLANVPDVNGVNLLYAGGE